MTDLIIRNGRVIDLASGVDEVRDIAVRDGMIASVGSVDEASAQVIDASGCMVTPGWIDVHVHLRQPGLDYKETVETGTAAAAAGGFVAVACMPNTKPALDSPAVLKALADDVEANGHCRVYPIASITKGRELTEDVDYDAVIEAGAIGWSDDGDSTPDSAIMRRALEASRRLGKPVIVHCEDKAIAHGAMHEGDVSRELGIEGIPAAAEEIYIARDCALAELTGGWLHVCHVSTGRGIEIIQQARERGAHITAEVMPHHLVMSDEWVAGNRELHNTIEPNVDRAAPADPNTKVNPPLRPVEDTQKLLKALQDGWFDCFGTDHAPHAESDKPADFAKAAMGMSGLEFAVPLTYALVRAGHISEVELVKRWTVEPAKVIGVEEPSLAQGAVANITVIDPDREWHVSPESLKTKSKNTAFLGRTLRGRAVLTVVDGTVQHHAE